MKIRGKTVLQVPRFEVGDIIVTLEDVQALMQGSGRTKNGPTAMKGWKWYVREVYHDHHGTVWYNVTDRSGVYYQKLRDKKFGHKVGSYLEKPCTAQEVTGSLSQEGGLPISHGESGS